MIVAGIGCRPKVDEQSLLDIVMQVTSGHGFDRLAAPEFRKRSQLFQSWQNV